MWFTYASMNMCKKELSKDICWYSIFDFTSAYIEEQAVIHASYGQLKGYFQSNPFRQQSLKTFAKSKSVFHASIVPWNSPLKPILQKASNQLTELGMMDHLVSKWEG